VNHPDSPPDRRPWYVIAYRVATRALRRLVRLGDRRVTVMFVPDSDRPVRSFQMRWFAALFVATLASLVLTSFVYLVAVGARTGESVDAAGDRLRQTEASLERVRGEVLDFLEVYAQFEGVLTDTVSRVEGESDEQPIAPAGADVASLLRLQSGQAGWEGDTELLEQAIALMRDSVGSLDRLADVIEVHKAVVEDLPTLWPVINGLGQVTMEFGPNIHPIQGMWYMHKGIDIAHYPGTPIISAANGVVTKTGFDRNGYGGYVEIDHNYGFKTKYGHLLDYQVTEGQEVVQGQLIGRMGNTGLSTGTHLDFQIWIGTENIDPAYFLKLSKPDFNRRTTNRS